MTRKKSRPRPLWAVAWKWVTYHKPKVDPFWQRGDKRVAHYVVEGLGLPGFDTKIIGFSASAVSQIKPN